MALLRPNAAGAEPSPPSHPPVPAPPDEVADLVGWTLAAQVLPPPAPPVDVIVRDAWDRPAAASGAPCAMRVEPLAGVALDDPTGERVDLSWAALGGRQRLAAVVVTAEETSWELHAGWPPSRVQERRYHRVEARLGAWLTRLGRSPLTALTRTVDLGAGGVAVERLPALGLTAGEAVAVAVMLPDQPLVATAVVIDVGTGERPARLAFEHITTADQDRLMGFVHQTDHGRLA
jgi:hypothetical protein